MADLTIVDQAHRRSLRSAKERFEAAAKALQTQIALAEEDGLTVFTKVSFRFPKTGEKLGVLTLDPEVRVGVQMEATRRIV